MLKLAKTATLLVISVALFNGCMKKDATPETNPGTTVEVVETASVFDENYRPAWWETLETTAYVFSYGMNDNADKMKGKEIAVANAQKKMVHFKKGYVVNLTQKILKECDAQKKFKSSKLNPIDKVIYSKDYSRYLQVIQDEYIKKDDSTQRAFVAIGFNLAEINKVYVEKFQRNRTLASVMAKSPTYAKMLKDAGVEAIKEKKIVPEYLIGFPMKEDVITKKEEPQVKYDKDIIPDWFRISHSTKKVMINCNAIGRSANSVENTAKQQCKDRVGKSVDNYARTEVERYRKTSGYSQEEFAVLKGNISKALKRKNFDSKFERKMINHTGKDEYKAYVQHSVDKAGIFNVMFSVIRDDDVLYSRLRAAQLFDELD